MSQPLTILITNNTLATRAGTELYARDLALALRDRGHRPYAYSPTCGQIADELRQAGVLVTEDLSAIAEPPDLIHGHHHLETMTALLHFHDVPAVFFCHGAVPWEEAPPAFPRILRYAAVDLVCRRRVAREIGIPEPEIALILNFVDLARFPARGPLPDRPRRALVFSNEATDQFLLPAIEQFGRSAGISVDCAGIGCRNSVEDPSSLLPRYDLVFAKGRCALEALASGCAVILCGPSGLGPLVKSEQLDRLRFCNFGLEALDRPVTSETLQREVAQYDPADAALVCHRIRTTCGLDHRIPEILDLYAATMEDYRRGTRDAAAELRATSAYVRRWGEELKSVKRRLSPNGNRRGAISGFD